MKRAFGLTLASGLAAAFLVAGCASTGGGGGASAGGQAAAGGTQTADNSAARDFNLQVKCPGIHLEKTKLKWDDDAIETHENVTADDIASCEKFTASQPKGYVPPPPPGTQQAAGAPAAGAPAAPTPH